MRIIFRVLNLGWGLLSRLVSIAERQSPEALIEAERERLHSLTTKFSKGLITHAAIIGRMQAQGKRLGDEAVDLERKIAAQLQISDRAGAARCALRLEGLKRSHDENARQLVDAERTYQDLLAARDRAVDRARARIEAVGQKLGETRAKEAIAGLYVMADAMQEQLGNAGRTLDGTEDIVENRLAEADAKIRVAKDSSCSLDIPDQDEQGVQEEAALARFEDRKAGQPSGMRPLLPGRDTILST